MVRPIHPIKTTTGSEERPGGRRLAVAGGPSSAFSYFPNETWCPALTWCLSRVVRSRCGGPRSCG